MREGVCEILFVFFESRNHLCQQRTVQSVNEALRGSCLVVWNRLRVYVPFAYSCVRNDDATEVTAGHCIGFVMRVRLSWHAHFSRTLSWIRQWASPACPTIQTSRIRDEFGATASLMNTAQHVVFQETKSFLLQLSCRGVCSIPIFLFIFVLTCAGHDHQTSCFPVDVRA